jgi:alcohol dehydrogenase class IV
MLPAALRTNRAVREADLARLARRVLRGSFSSDAAAVDAFLDEIDSLCRDVNIPGRLRDLGVQRGQIPAVAAGSRGNSLSGNPREISDAELNDLLEAMW